MATVTGTRRRRAAFAAQTPDDYPPPRTARWPAAAFVLLGLALLVWFLPALVAATPLRNTLVRQLCGELNATVSIDSLSLGWLSPVVGQGLDVRHDEGEPLLHIPRLATEKSLLSLALDRTDLGVVRVERPRVEIVLRGDGSNLEDVLADWLKPNADASRGPALAVEVVDATVRLAHLGTKSVWQIEPLNATCKVPARNDEPMVISTDGQVLGGERPAGFLLHYANRATDTDAAAAIGELTLKTERLPLALLELLLARVAPGTRVQGQLEADLVAGWDSTLPAEEARRWCRGRVLADRLVVGGPWLAGDQLALERVELPCKLTEQSGRLKIEELSLACELGQVACTADLEPTDAWLAASSMTERVALLLDARGRLNGQVDLARLAHALPRLLHLRDGLQVTSGQVRLDIESVGGSQQRQWRGMLETTPLAATSGGRELRWEQPLRATLTARHDARGPAIDRLTCDSEFLKIEAAGQLDSFDLAAACDLNQLVAQVSQFADLQGLRLAGEGATQLRWQRDGSGQFSLQSRTQVDRFELSAPDWSPWVERQLVLSATAHGRYADASLTHLAKAQLQLESGGDHLLATLAQPVNRPTAESTYPLAVTAEGKLATWAPRLAPWAAMLTGWNLDGQFNLSADVNYRTDQIELSRAQVDLRQLRAWGHGWYISEPEARLLGKARWTSADSQLAVAWLSAESPSLALQVQELLLAMPAAGSPSVGGKIMASGNLARLQNWLQDPVTPPTWRWEGQFEARATIAHRDDVASAELDATVANLSAATAQGVVWREPKCRLVSAARYEPTSDRLAIQHARFDSKMAQIELAGQVDQPGGARVIDLHGRGEYDLDQLTRLLEPYLGSAVQLSGRQSQAFHLVGPLSASSAPGVPGEFALERLSGRAGLGWQQANLFGFLLGPTEFDAQLQQGLLRMTPADIPLSRGRLRLAPTVRLAPGPMELTHDPGVVVDRAHVTPLMCNQALMYVAPVMAGVAEAQGEFSLALQGCRVPLADPQALDMAGTLTIHDVQIGPGPLVQELAVLLGRAYPAQLKREAQVDFRVVQGRVYHQNLELVFPDLTIRTHGSVGLDRTLSLVAEMPIPPKWLGNNPLGAALRDQRIQLPIGGTLDRPRLDRQALERASAEVVRGAADSVIRDKLNSQLDRLFGPSVQPR